jgi:hypothetical protein
MNTDALMNLISQQYDRGVRDGENNATRIALGSSNYDATQSAIVAVEFTSFLELRQTIRANNHRTYSDNPGSAYMWTCDLIHIHHNDYNKVALLKFATHYDI